MPTKSLVASKLFALIDCDNFFVSCERLLDSSLNNQPVIVLSNNDGCIISRSKEAKALGIKMGEPYHFVKKLVQQNKVHVFSGHFHHYTQVSRQVINTLKSFSPNVEVYSVDEAFLDLSGFQKRDLTAYGFSMYQSILDNVGVPVSIGIASNKTLCKIAVHWAKQNQLKVLNWQNLTPIEKTEKLKQTPIDEIWGVGFRLNHRLKKMGILTAYDLTQANDKQLINQFGSMLGRTLFELRGVHCIPLETEHKLRKSMIFSRSFGQAVYSYQQMQEVITTYTSRVCEKLRKENLCTQAIGISIKTSKFRPNETQYKNFAQYRLPQASCNTAELNQISLELLETIFKPNIAYRKAGIYLWGLVPNNEIQLNLFSQAASLKSDLSKGSRLMQSLDAINHRFGTGKLHFASEGFEHDWQVKKAFNQHPQHNNTSKREQELFMSTEGLRFL